MKRRRFLYSGAAVLCGVAALVYFRGSPPAQPITRSFAAPGVKRVVLRASQARMAKVRTTRENKIKISGLPIGGAKGYHPSEPGWRQTPAQNCGLDFVAKRYGKTLVISTKNETLYIHHHYGLGNITVQVPEGVTVLKEELMRDGQGKPNLSKPNLSKPK